MKKLFYILIYCIISSTVNAQMVSAVDIAPLGISCEGSWEEKIACTEDLFFEYFLGDIDSLQCPVLDSTADFRISFVVDVDGNIKDGKLNRYGDETPCDVYFSKKAASMGDYIHMVPAQKGNQATEFRKTFEFIYPVFRDSMNVELDTSRLFKIVEEMPRFNGCEEMIGTGLDKENCSQTKMLMFIYSNLKYPTEAREDGVEGMVVVQFVVDTTGMLLDIKTVRDIGAKCGEAVEDVMHLMNQQDQPPFIPGVQRGRKVKVLYTMPVKFKLESGKKKKKKKKRKK